MFVVVETIFSKCRKNGKLKDMFSPDKLANILLPIKVFFSCFMCNANVSRRTVLFVKLCLCRLCNLRCFSGRMCLLDIV